MPPNLDFSNIDSDTLGRMTGLYTGVPLPRTASTELMPGVTSTELVLGMASTAMVLQVESAELVLGMTSTALVRGLLVVLFAAVTSTLAGG